jgi:hypothetical protein
MKRSALVVLAGVLSLAACSGGAGLSAAKHGDLAALRLQIGAREQAASLHLAEVGELARATATHEISVATGESAVARIREVEACAPELDDVLSARMKKGDAAGAEAAMALLDAGRLSDGDARSYLKFPDPLWRAVGVRGLTRTRDAGERRASLLDPSPLVRRAALRAMNEAPDGADLAPVFEVARGDPEPIVRTDAVRLLALMGRREPESDLATLPADITRLLRDLYPTADEPLREDIGAAWAAPEVFSHGGREALRVLLASEQGAGALSAAAAVLREPRVIDPEIEAAARATLVRAIESGARRHRLHAIAMVPLDKGKGPRPREKGPQPLLEALEKASVDEDLDVRVSALGRLASLAAPPESRPKAILGLEALAGGSDPPELISRARLILANAGDLRVQAWVEKDLGASEAWTRLSAVGALVALGRATRAAPILGDSDPSVRTRGACALILAARLGSSLR